MHKKDLERARAYGRTVAMLQFLYLGMGDSDRLEPGCWHLALARDTVDVVALSALFPTDLILFRVSAEKPGTLPNS